MHESGPGPQTHVRPRGKLGRLIRDGAPAEEVEAARRELKDAVLGNRLLRLVDDVQDTVATVPDVDAWAARFAASLPPMDSDEAAAAGRLAAILDGRIALDGAA